MRRCSGSGFYHPTWRRVLPSQDVTFDETVPFYHLFPYHSAPPPPSPLFLAPGPPPVDPLPPQGLAPSGVSQVDPLLGTAPVQVGVVSGAAPGAASGGAEPGGAGSEGAGSGGAEPEGVEPGGAESEGAEPGGAESERAESGGAEPRGAASSRGPAGASPRLSLQQLRECLVQRAHRRSGPLGASKPGDTGAGGAAVTTGAGDPTEPGAAGAGGAGAGVAGVGGTSAGGAGAVAAGAVDPGAGGAGGTMRPCPYFVPLLQQSQPPLQPASLLPVPSPYNEQSGGLTERREPVSRTVSPVRTARRAPRSRPPPVPGTHPMALRPSFVPLRVPLPAPPESSLPEFAAASALVVELLDFAAACRLDYASALVTESVLANPPSVGGECALGTDVVEDRQEDFECLAAAVPRFASLLLAHEGDPDAPNIPTPRSYAEAITGPYSSQWQAAMDAEMASWKSTGTYVGEVPPHGVNIVDGMWIFRVKRPPGSPPAFKGRYIAQGFSQRQGVDYFQTFSPTPKMTTLRGSLHEEIWLRRPPGFTRTFPAGTQWSLRRPVYGLRKAPREWHDTLRTTLAALGFAPSTADPSLFLRIYTSLPPFYVLVYADDLVFATADTEALTLVKSELQKRYTCTDLGELLSYLGLQITRKRARRTITLTESHMVHQVLQRFGFQYSSPQPTPLSTNHSLSDPPSDESVEPSGPYPELQGCLMYLMTCTRPDLAYPLSLLARYVAPVRWAWGLCLEHGVQLSSLVTQMPPGLTTQLHSGRHRVTPSALGPARFLGGLPTRLQFSAPVVRLRSTPEPWLLKSYAGSPTCCPTWESNLVRLQSCFVDNKAMIALCQEHRLEHRTKHIALRYFLARELQQHGQLRLAYVAIRANTADVFTKAIPPACFALLLLLTGLVTIACSCYPPLRLCGATTASYASCAACSSGSSIASDSPCSSCSYVTDNHPVLTLLLPSAFDEYLSEPDSNKGPDVYEDWRAEGDVSAEGGTEADTEAGTAEDVFPEGAPGSDDDDGVEYWSRDGLPEKLPMPTYPPRNRKRPHPSSQNRDSRPPSPRHKPNNHKCQAYTAAEKLKWVAQLDVAVSVRALAHESGIHHKCLANWKRAADFLKEAHSARKRMHGRGRASWYRPMEIKVYERLLDWRRKGTAPMVVGPVPSAVESQRANEDEGRPENRRP
ncbi:unnamed protein product [Closterium sp. NIES-53]